MTFNWDNVKYLFQIPLEWFQAVHDRIFKAYGTNFIVVKGDDDGAMNIDVDETIFNSAVNSAISSQGFVRSVDNVAPDGNGNIQLNAVKTVNDVSPNSNGNVDLGNIVKRVDGVYPNSNGNVSFGLAASKWVKTNSQGHLTTTNDQPITINTSQYTPTTIQLDVVVDVTWNGTKLQYAKRQFNFVNGVLVNVGNANVVDIDTAVTYNP